MRYTTTHTTYFSAESLQGLQNEYDHLCEDWSKRRPHITEEAAHAGDVRLRALEAALILLREPVPESFGG